MYLTLTFKNKQTNETIINGYVNMPLMERVPDDLVKQSCDRFEFNVMGATYQGGANSTTTEFGHEFLDETQGLSRWDHTRHHSLVLITGNPDTVSTLKDYINYTSRHLAGYNGLESDDIEASVCNPLTPDQPYIVV